MNFDLDEELVAVRDLAGRIFADHADQESVAAAESTPDGVDGDLYARLADAGLTGTPLPEDAGGAGLGMPALCALLEQQGRAVAAVPLWSTLVAALAIAEHGSPEQRKGLLPEVAGGQRRLAPALEEFAPASPQAPSCTAKLEGQQWVLAGSKALVPDAAAASHLLVAASTDRGTGLFLVAAGADGIGMRLADTTAHQRGWHLELDGVAAEQVGEPGSGVLDWTLRRARVALAATQLGVAERALEHAASYLGGRAQFGRPLASFQAVAHQLADCYIDVRAIRVTMWQAAGELAAAADPEAVERSVLVAAWWAAEAGLNVVHRVQHLHGGIGVDVSYPVHRHFLWGKQIAGTLGGASATLADLGAKLAVGS